jgi:hypothetical protein
MLMWGQLPRLSGGPGVSGPQAFVFGLLSQRIRKIENPPAHSKILPRACRSIPPVQHALSSRAPTNSTTLVILKARALCAPEGPMESLPPPMRHPRGTVPTLRATPAHNRVSCSAISPRAKHALGQYSRAFRVTRSVVSVCGATPALLPLHKCPLTWLSTIAGDEGKRWSRSAPPRSCGDWDSDQIIADSKSEC